MAIWAQMLRMAQMLSRAQLLSRAQMLSRAPLLSSVDPNPQGLTGLGLTLLSICALLSSCARYKQVIRTLLLLVWFYATWQGTAQN